MRKCSKCKIEKPFYRYLRDQGYLSGYQVLCWDCNAIKHQAPDQLEAYAGYVGLCIKI